MEQTANKVESANLILKLYELRREDKMREARNWMVSFFPENTDEVLQTMINVETSAYYRMITTYWDMAAAFVNHGAIDEELFNDVQSEHIVLFSKIAPFIQELRIKLGNPGYLHNLEKLIMKIPNAEEILVQRRELMKNWMKARSRTAEDKS